MSDESGNTEASSVATELAGLQRELVDVRRENARLLKLLKLTEQD